MTGLGKSGAGVEVTTEAGSIRAGKVLLATAAFKVPVRADPPPGDPGL